MSISKFKLWISQLFCSHIWKAESAEDLNLSHLDYTVYPPVRYYHFAVTERCLKCNKTRIVEKHSMKSQL